MPKSRCHPSHILFALQGASSQFPRGSLASPVLVAQGGGSRSRPSREDNPKTSSRRRWVVAGVRWRRWPPCPPAGTACSTPLPSSRPPHNGAFWPTEQPKTRAGFMKSRWKEVIHPPHDLELWALRCSSVAGGRPNSRQRQAGAESAPLYPPKGRKRPRTGPLILTAPQVGQSVSLRFQPGIARLLALCSGLVPDGGGGGGGRRVPAPARRRVGHAVPEDAGDPVALPPHQPVSSESKSTAQRRKLFSRPVGKNV